MAAAVRIGTCSFADDALVKHWYPPSVSAKGRLAYYAGQFSTVEIDSTFYAIPSEQTVRGWAERTPADFIVHIKAFGVMTRHPVPIERLPPELRDELPVDAHGRVHRPSPQARGLVFSRFLQVLEPLRSVGKLGGILFQLPPFIPAEQAAFDYLDWARGQMPDEEMLVEFRHRSWFDEDRREEVLGFLEQRRMSYVSVDAPELDDPRVPRTLVAATTPLAYIRFHGRNAATWNRRGGGAAARFDYRYTTPELAEWVEPLAELSAASQAIYAFFNTNNVSDGIAQGPANAQVLRQLLSDYGVPVR